MWHMPSSTVFVCSLSSACMARSSVAAGPSILRISSGATSRSAIFSSADTTMSPRDVSDSSTRSASFSAALSAEGSGLTVGTPLGPCKGPSLETIPYCN